MPALLVNTVSVSPAAPRPRSSRQATARRASARHRCRAEASGSGSGTNGGDSGYRPGGVRGSWVSDYDLYELLGVERSSPQSEIKAAYRSLQKRCHPDVAGAAGGHDMAVVLNEVYALLSDPAARLAYDQEQARRSEFAGYTGRPLYSSWLGPESERRAVFVDEVRCVGCLKCALHASRTFAVESVYGRARAVAQWADDEDRIVDAINTCPVDCISMVERSDLAALEFLMSKQPRGRVRVSEGNAVGARAPNVFNEVAKFQKRFEEMKQKSATRESQESEEARQSRTSAVHTIRSMSNWWYWRPFGFGPSAPATIVRASRLLPPPAAAAPTDTVTERLQEAAAARRKTEGAATAHARRDDYWTPQLDLPSSASPPSIHQRGKDAPTPQGHGRRRGAAGEAAAGAGAGRKGISIDLTAALLLGIVVAGFVGYNGEVVAGGGSGIQEHVGGAVALGVVNSFEMKVMLAGVTWFLIGAAIAGVIQVLGRREQNIWK
ncbi:chaperone protein dnaJ C76, chloroplastic-like [Miscanthus floridulus]|uniref:chaperone protein dnaJ C76, chloroplastic-like n=1 Tax=Miscanthus floridulus TaxID=154761 RepID=UPI0034594D01